jgi:4-hydroxythreonine-4-phosphate dehydrogenase
MKKPKIAITLGDPLGIGLEIVSKALKNPKIKKLCTPILLGDINLLRKYGLTICKKSWAMADVPFTGHTDFLRHYLKTSDALMIFISKNIRCTLVTEHIALSKVSKFITKVKIISVCRNFKKALKLTGVKNPRIAFCGLNPHLGDGGTFAKEEETIIKPALKKIKNVTLLPADSAWQKHITGSYDGVICTYHDQALIPLKTLSKSPIIHWTYGLPFIRTSPAHGTAFDIAGKNKADACSMTEAILSAAKFCR